MKGVLTFTVQVWQTDVQVHFYFPSTVFVWVIHVELINSGGQKHRRVQVQGTPKNLQGRGKRRLERGGLTVGWLKLSYREQGKLSRMEWGQIMA